MSLSGFQLVLSPLYASGAKALHCVVCYRTSSRETRFLKFDFIDSVLISQWSILRRHRDVGQDLACTFNFLVGHDLVRGVMKVLGDNSMGLGLQWQQEEIQQGRQLIVHTRHIQAGYMYMGALEGQGRSIQLWLQGYGISTYGCGNRHGHGLGPCWHSQLLGGWGVLDATSGKTLFPKVQPRCHFGQPRRLSCLVHPGELEVKVPSVARS